MNTEPGTGDIFTSIEPELPWQYQSPNEILADLMRRILARPDGAVIRTAFQSGDSRRRLTLIIDTPTSLTLTDEEAEVLHAERRSFANRVIGTVTPAWQLAEEPCPIADGDSPCVLPAGHHSNCFR
jgi:hypothetical protein